MRVRSGDKLQTHFPYGFIARDLADALEFFIARPRSLLWCEAVGAAMLAGSYEQAEDFLLRHETLRELMALGREWEAAEARKAFFKALAAAKEELPASLPRTGSASFAGKAPGSGHVDYSYVEFGRALEVISPILARHGLALSQATEQPEQHGCNVTTHLTHELGHRESVTIRAPLDDTGRKNTIQQIGSTLTYCARYGTFQLLGLAAAPDPGGDDATQEG